MRVFEALCAAGAPLSLKDLARVSGLPASNCHRYCVSFLRTAYFSQDARGRYDLGPKALQAGLAALSRLDAIAIATEALEQLVEDTGHTGQLAIWSERGPLALRWLPGRTAVRTSLSTGSILPLLTSATGRVFLAHLPARQTGVMASREAMVGGGDPEVLAGHVRAVGYGSVSGDHIPGLSAISAPILDWYGEAAAAITLVGTKAGFNAAAIDQLLRAAAVASERLGWKASDTATA